VILVAADRLAQERIYGSLVAGQLLWLLGALVFVLAPAGSMVLVILWAVCSALSKTLLNPAERSYWASIIDDRERAQMFSASWALTSLVSLPAGPLAGALYVLFPKGPFLLGLALQVVVLALILSLQSANRERVYT
jgi:MFS family permease